MIQFNKSSVKNGECAPESVTLTVVGQKDEYIETIKALVGVLGGVEEDFISQRERYLICNLIDGMLPDSRQIVTMEEVSELERIKGQNIEKIKEVTE